NYCTGPFMWHGLLFPGPQHFISHLLFQLPGFFLFYFFCLTFFLITLHHSIFSLFSTHNGKKVVLGLSVSLGHPNARCTHSHTQPHTHTHTHTHTQQLGHTRTHTHTQHTHTNTHTHKHTHLHTHTHTHTYTH